jgi:hypothetical protein
VTPGDFKHDAEAMLKGTALLKSIGQARSEHLTYEQMDAWVEDEMDQTAREWVVAHIGLCDFCAKQLSAYESYAPAMSAPIAAPAKLIPFRERFRAAFGWPQIAMVALAIVVAILAPIAIRNSRSSGIQSIEARSLAALPPSLRHAAEDVVNANTALRPTVLADLAPNVDPRIDNPASEVVEETHPTLHWQRFAASYAVSISDGAGHIAAQASDLTTSEWTVPIELQRGVKYEWEISTTSLPGENHHAWFRVLGASEEQTLAELRASGAGPLALGAVEQQFGLLTLAQHEFEELSKEFPQSVDATKLLDHIHSIRGN